MKIQMQDPGGKVKVRLIAKTQICNQDLLDSLSSNSPEELIMYCARVSNPENQESGKTGLLNYCANHGHWSIFEMSNMVIEIETTRAISTQILRHRSFSFQEFSQRYKEVTAFDDSFEIYSARRQDVKNRQNSIDDMPEEDRLWFEGSQLDVQELAVDKYQEALDRGIAKEQARFLLPMNSKTKLYMNGNIRSWIHYLNIRCDKSTQLEHREIAEEIKKIFVEQFPNVSKALEWDSEE